MHSYQIPENSALRSPDFIFGVSTSSYQIEGGVHEGGRGVSIWDTFSHREGTIENNDNGDVACDHYHLWEQDIEMIHDLGVDAYRLSIAWPRIVPEEGVVNAQGLAFYKKIIDACHAKGIKVFVTLYHWDLPQYLEDRGGWLNRETAYKFAAYADIVSAFFGDRIDVYTTLNEPLVSSYLGYRLGIHAPGIKGDKEGFQASHHLMLAHGLAMPVLRKNAPNSRHGLVINAGPAYPESPSDQDAADYFDAEFWHWFIDPVLKGEYPAAVLERQSQNRPLILKGDLDIISAPIDYLGINYYSRFVVRFTPDHQIEVVDQENVEKTLMGWEIYPQGLTDLLVRIKERYQHLPPIYITENGASGDDKVDENGEVHDEQRIRYVQEHLNALDTAIKRGVRVDGYFAWSLMDNFEWAYGYRQRFGMVHVDYQSQKRTLKDSAIAYKKMLKDRKAEKNNG